MNKGVGTRVFWVQTGGYDTHAGQNPNQANGTYTTLMTTLNDALLAFYNDLLNQGLLGDTLVLQFSEFGRRITENAQQRHRPRRRERDAGHGRRSARRASTAPRRISGRPRTIRRSRTTAPTCDTRQTSGPSTRV